jgi:hypothetical protein
MNSDPRDINFLVSSLYTKELKPKLLEHEKLLNVVRASLPGFLAEKSRYCIVNSNTLVIYSESQAFSSQLRFFEPTIMQSLKQELRVNCTRVLVRNLFSNKDIGERVVTRKLLDAKVADQITDVAISFQDEDIKRALTRLGSTLRKKSKGTKLD